MYKDDMGIKIKHIRRDIFGYSRTKLAKLVNEDRETIVMLENGLLKNPQPQLILRIADVLDSFYMEFVNKDYEDEFLSYLDWGTNDKYKINILKDISLMISDILIISRRNNAR